MILNQMAAGIPQVHSAAFDFFLSVVLICYSYLQIFELCHIFKGFIVCVYVLCFCAAWPWNRNIFPAFSTFPSRPVSLQWTNEAYGVYALTP